jgi:hypothetical protein
VASLSPFGSPPLLAKSPSRLPRADLISSFRTCFQPGSRLHFRTCLEIKQASTARAWLARVGRDRGIDHLKGQGEEAPSFITSLEPLHRSRFAHLNLEFRLTWRFQRG